MSCRDGSELRRLTIREGVLRKAPPAFDPLTGAPQGATWQQHYARFIEGVPAIRGVYRAILAVACDVRLVTNPADGEAQRESILKALVWDGRRSHFIEHPVDGYGANDWWAERTIGRLIDELARHGELDGAAAGFLAEDLGASLVEQYAVYAEWLRERRANQEDDATRDARELMAEINREAERMARQAAVQALAKPRQLRLVREYVRALRLTLVAGAEGADE